MSLTIIILLRILHITAGVFWVGSIMFLNIFLGPSVAAVGPDGTKVMRELVRRGYFEKIIIGATITILTGLLLIWQDSAGSSGAWFGTPMGRGISTGMLAAIIAYVVGVAVVRPTMLEMLSLGAQAAEASGSAKDALMGQMAATRTKLIKLGGFTMILLIIAVVAMAVARYM